MSSPAAVPAAGRGGRELVSALRAARGRLGLIALLLALAAVAWWSTATRMRGMDDGPRTDLGALGWFVGVWVVMTAAMMLPSVAPTVALYAKMTRRRSPLAPLVFCIAYLVTWSATGVLAYAAFAAERATVGGELTWAGAGRWLACGTLLAAAAYELTSYKDVCRTPLAFLLGSWRGGLRGAFSMGARHGAWCVGCCWGLMAALFALGVMSLAWMAVVAALIALEKTLPWQRPVTYATAALLLVVGVLLLAAPDALPGLTRPGDDADVAMSAR